MTATDTDDTEPQERALTIAVRDYLADPSEEHRTRVVHAMTHPLGRVDMPDEVAALQKVLQRVLADEIPDSEYEDTLNSVGWYAYQLRPTGRLRVVADDWQAEVDDDPALQGLSTERPPPPDPVDQDEADIAYRVRNFRLNDEARTRWNAERNSSSIPEALDVAAVVRGEYDPLLPTMLTRDDGVSLMYPGLLHWLYGPDGLGKTMVAAYAVAQLLRVGGHVAYFDWEGNPTVIGDRLRDMHVDANTVAKQFHYYRPGNLEPHTGWLEAGASAEWHLAIFDGTARALAASGRNEEDNPDVLAWLEAVVTPLTGNGCAVMMLDHVTKDPEGRGMPRGAGAKRGEVSGAAWELKAGQPYNRRTAGFVKLVQRKDREGRTGIDGDIVAELHATPSRQGTTFALRAPTKNAADLARARAMENTYNAVTSWAAANSALPSTTSVAKITGATRAHTSELLDELADLGHVRSYKQGNGRPTEWEPVAPYRAPVAEPSPGPLTAPQEAWDVLRGD